MQPEWGSSWSNRIYRRVVQLDRVAQSTRLIYLSHAENLAASKALSLAIMAFATQWSQGRGRKRQADDIADDLADEFEKNIQQSVWEQGRRALESVSDLESFRVVYAELIFGLIQRPWSDDDKVMKDKLDEQSSSATETLEDSTLLLITNILSLQGPPIYLERAARKMHALKFQFDAFEMGLHQANQYWQSNDRTQMISEDDKRTIGLLYWLAVMFDTVSSSMNERPVALADEDCQHDDVPEEPLKPNTSASKGRMAYQRWVVDLFLQDNPDRPCLPPRWPCAYDVAATAVVKSAPVKILLFRQVSYLQNALRKRQYGDPVEEAVKNAISLYRYWNRTYGTFFRSLVKDYGSVPARIKSWFVCIAIPWHLAALMLADLLEFVDNNQLGQNESSNTRLSLNLVATIRKGSATELSELAEVTTPAVDAESRDTTTYQLPDLHFAVNQGSLLTEPWTMLLIRAFAKASMFQLINAETLKRDECDILGYRSQDFQDSLRRSDKCIQALWFLGRKSDAARHISVILAHALHRLQTE